MVKLDEKPVDKKESREINLNAAFKDAERYTNLKGKKNGNIEYPTGSKLTTKSPLVKKIFSI